VDVKGEVAAIERKFRAMGTPERAAGEKAYLKSDLDFLGVTQPQIRVAARELHRRFRDLDRDTLLAMVEALWQTRYHEMRMLGIALLERYAERLHAHDMAFIESLVRRANTWAQVDWLAIHVAGELVLRYTGARKALRRWSTDDVMWLRRSSMLALLPELRRGQGDFDLFAAFASGMVEETDFFIRKAIGWVLREVSRNNPDLTYDFLTEHIERVSGVTYREGSRKLPAAQRADLKKRYHERTDRRPRPRRRRG
jgi:3-methyladenine DNA glycosylase AlkD